MRRVCLGKAAKLNKMISGAVTAVDNEEWTPLHYAAKSGQREAFKTLVGLESSLLMAADGEVAHGV